MTSWRGRRDIHVLDVDEMTTACLWISTAFRRQRGRNDEDRGSNDEYCGRNDETRCPEPPALGLQPLKTRHLIHVLTFVRAATGCPRHDARRFSLLSSFDPHCR